MTYKTLETTPYKVVLKITNDPVSNLHLLTDDEHPDMEKLGKIWMSIYEELKDLDPNNEGDKIFQIEKEIDALSCKHDFIQLSLVALEFDYDEELAQMLIDYGYKLTKENYYPDLERIRRESKAILNLINRFKNQLPKQEEDNKKDFKKVNIDEVLAFYCTVLGIDFDYNTVSYTKVQAIQNQVSEKIKAIGKQNSLKK